MRKLFIRSLCLVVCLILLLSANVAAYFDPPEVTYASVYAARKTDTVAYYSAQTLTGDGRVYLTATCRLYENGLKSGFQSAGEFSVIEGVSYE